jgi:hypothetical protein
MELLELSMVALELSGLALELSGVALELSGLALELRAPLIKCRELVKLKLSKRLLCRVLSTAKVNGQQERALMV